MTSILKAFWQEEDGQDLVEYSLLLAFIALAAIAMLANVGKSINNMFSGMNTTMQKAASSAVSAGTAS